jgi:hypothetical protein
MKIKNIIGDKNPNFRHGYAHTRLYSIHQGIKKRCYNKNSYKYKHYGERGIIMCEEWKLFSTFRDWAISNGYSDELSIDRIDVDGNYEPGNCRWATQKEQTNNLRKNIRYDYYGQLLTLSQISDIVNLPVRFLSNRMRVKNSVTIYEAIENINSIVGSNQFSKKF